MQRIISALAIVTLLVGFNFLPAKADVATVPAGPSIAGTVVDSEGHAVGAGIEVKLFKHEKHAGGKKEGGKAARQRPVALLTAITDGNGHFTFTGLELGAYMVGARDKGVGHGHCKVDVAGAATPVTITLEKGKPGKNKGA